MNKEDNIISEIKVLLIKKRLDPRKTGKKITTRLKALGFEKKI